jgi:predicted Zn-dependent protease
VSTERITELEELLRDEPDDPLLLLTLGKEYLDGGDPARALPVLERVVAVDPDYTAAYRYLGSALERVGRRDEAIAAWERGVAVADRTGDLQAGKEMQIFLTRLRGRG